MQTQDPSQQTGTQNETYDVISILYHALKGAENCHTSLQDAKEGPIRDFIQQALQAQRQLADQGKEVLQQCLQNDTDGSSAFGWGQSERQSGMGGKGRDQSQSGQSGSSGSSESSFGGQSRSGFGSQTTSGEQSGGQDPSSLAEQNPGQTTGRTSF